MEHLFYLNITLILKKIFKLFKIAILIYFLMNFSNIVEGMSLNVLFPYDTIYGLLICMEIEICKILIRYLNVKYNLLLDNQSSFFSKYPYRKVLYTQKMMSS